ncbi:MAG: hypothetical protein WDZ70_01815 [Candidatus Paceibacterota bacterium]
MKFEAGDIYNLEDILEASETLESGKNDLLWFLLGFILIILLMMLEGGISPPFFSI